MNPTEVMATHGKSFYFASLFFPQNQFMKIARLYMLCRKVDDTADELEASRALPALIEIRQQISDPTHQGPWQEAISTLSSYGVERRHMLELLDGAEFDARGGAITDQAMLLKYCYWVAGVVGLMMCPLLGVREARASRHAVDLGIGMQLTNICRDVRADAHGGRVYLPADALAQAGLNFEDLRAETASESLRRLVREHLDLADKFYANAYRGLAYLPFRARLCIVLAGEVYRHIGVKIRSKDYDVLHGRTYLSYFEKLVVACKCLSFFIRPRFWRPREAVA